MLVVITSANQTYQYVIKNSIEYMNLNENVI